MFGRKKKQDKSLPKGEKKPNGDKPNVRMTVIPKGFYGGADPIIYNKEPKLKKIAAPSMHKEIVQKKPEVDKKIEASVPKPMTAPAVRVDNKMEMKDARNNKEAQIPPLVKKKTGHKKKFVVLVIIIIFLLLASIVSWLYLSRGSEDKKMPAAEQATSPRPVVIPQPKPVTPPKPVVVTNTPKKIDKPTSTPRLRLSFPSMFLQNSGDLDADDVTDIEEELLNTDSGVWDTDGDGYFDGQELFNLYNPAGFAPVRLIDSGLIREYVSPMLGYRIYHPIAWRASAVESNGSHVIFSSIIGDYIEIYTFENHKKESFQDWFAENARGQKYSDLDESTNRFQVTGFKRSDSLVAYFWSEDQIFVMTYNVGSNIEVSFPNVMKMMIQSFRKSKVMVEIPDQPVLPVPGLVSTSTTATSTDSASFSSSTNTGLVENNTTTTVSRGIPIRQ